MGGKVHLQILSGLCFMKSENLFVSSLERRRREISIFTWGVGGSVRRWNRKVIRSVKSSVRAVPLRCQAFFIFVIFLSASLQAVLRCLGSKIRYGTLYEIH